jgi:hypothetical protein
VSCHGARGAEPVTEVRVAPADLPRDLFRVGLDQELVRLEAMTGLGLVRAMDAVAVEQSRPRLGQIAMPHFVGALGKRDTLDLAAAARIEDTELDLLAFAENSAKLTPSPSQVAPCG